MCCLGIKKGNEGDLLMEITYVGQNGFIITDNKIKICFDLYLSNCVLEKTGRGKRNYESPYDVQAVADVDYYFISHNHLDHLDIDTISKLAVCATDIIYICPAPYQKVLEELGIQKKNIIPAKAYETYKIFDDLQFTAIPEKHEEYLLINGEHCNLGYVIAWGKYNIYFAGDVIADKKLAEDLKAKGPYNIMFVPINGHDWKRYDEDLMGNMTYREAVDLCCYVGTDYIVPMHYDLFENNTENPAFFVDYLYRKYFGQKFKMFMPEESMIVN